MGLETKLVQKLNQSLLMTPQLQQAIKLLQLGRLEYKEAIENELLENPILEEIKENDESYAPSSNNENESGAGDGENYSAGPESEGESFEEKPAGEASPVDYENYLESFSDVKGSASPKGNNDFDDRPSLEATLTRTESLQEHMIAQIRMAGFSKLEEYIALIVVGNLNKDGYLCVSHEEIAEQSKCETADVERVCEQMQSFDPPGIAARDLRECLLVQLDHMGLGESLESRIIRDHLDRLEKRKYDQIAKVEGVAVEKIYKAISIIQSLEPRPGRPFADETTRYVVPDIYVYKVGSDYVISLNEEGLPRLRVSPYYIKMLQNGDSSNNPNKAYLAERLKAASWLIKSIHQRQQTIFKVTESIVKFQRGFLDNGIGSLKPLVLKDVADDIGMHESTVSRVTTNKYVHTPQGVFELKFFFTTGIKTAEGDVSSSSIKEKIRNIISAEPADNPISDQGIVDILKKENVTIARRTVAKYREGLGILSSSQRKKLF